ncbi:MAG: hypothetical protein PVF68_08295 [Acidobacteriota bacterium]|jgi:hypothetical protein
MNVQQIAEGLWRWTAPHPGWTPERGGPGGWDRMVGCIYFEAPDGVVLVDPLAPPEGTPEAEKFWTALDRDVRRLGRPVAVLVANGHHGRHADVVRRRYMDDFGASIHAPAAAEGKIACTPTHRFHDGAVLPGGVKARAIEGLDGGETAFLLPGHEALVFADAVLGAGEGRARVAPASWAAEDSESQAAYAARFRPSLRRLVSLHPAILLPSHGEPILEGGEAALTEALEAPAWG